MPQCHLSSLRRWWFGRMRGLSFLFLVDGVFFSVEEMLCWTFFFVLVFFGLGCKRNQIAKNDGEIVRVHGIVLSSCFSFPILDIACSKHPCDDSLRLMTIFFFSPDTTYPCIFYQVSVPVDAVKYVLITKRR